MNSIYYIKIWNACRSYKFILFWGGNEAVIKNSRKGVDEVKKWFDFQKFALNENKTKFMVFGGIRANCDIKLNLNEFKLKEFMKVSFWK